jgi:hypothetical protein
MLFEVDTDIYGVTCLLEAGVKINLHDAQQDPEVARELVARCVADPMQGFLYTSDLAKQDRWSTFVPMFKRTKPGQPIKCDCEDETMAYGAAMCIILPKSTVIEVAITQPGEGMMAHAFLYVNGVPYDPSAINGMRRPPDRFYGSGETARIIIAR